jgi:hypothetical protein
MVRLVRRTLVLFGCALVLSGAATSAQTARQATQGG